MAGRRGNRRPVAYNTEAIVEVKVTLEDDKEYAFNAVPVGTLRKYGEMLQEGPTKIPEANAMLMLASLKKAHPEVTREDLEFTLITLENTQAVEAAIQKASGVKPGEAGPVAL